MTVSVACVGELTLDWLLARGTTTGPQVGGSALYAAIGVWLAGGKPRIVARVGEDYPAHLLEDLEARGLCTRGVSHVSGNSYHMLLEDWANRRIARYLPDSGTGPALDPSLGDLGSDDEDGGAPMSCPPRSATDSSRTLPCPFPLHDS